MSALLCFSTLGSVICTPLTDLSCNSNLLRKSTAPQRAAQLITNWEKYVEAKSIKHLERPEIKEKSKL